MSKNPPPPEDVNDCARLTSVLIDVVKRWRGSEDAVDARLVAVAFGAAAGAYLRQVPGEEDRRLLLAAMVEGAVRGTMGEVEEETEQ